MTPASHGGDGGVVRIPADLDRDDRILLGLSARQLATLTVAGVAAWTLAGWLDQLLGLPVAAALAAPVALAGVAVTGDHHPLVNQHVVADLRRRPGRGDVPAVGLGAVGTWLVVEVQQLTTICQSAGRPGHVSRHHLETSAGI
jgi:hypothetical protein